MQSNVRQCRPAWESAIKPHPHLQYAAPPHKQTLPLQSALFLVTTPTPTTSRRPSPYTASMTMQLQAAVGRCRAGCCHSSQWRSAWCLVFFHSNRMQMAVKPAWGPPPFSSLESVLPCDYHTSVTFALGVTKVPDLSLGRTSVSVFGAFSNKNKDWMIPLTF